jgi:hypothetical protein
MRRLGEAFDTAKADPSRLKECQEIMYKVVAGFPPDWWMPFELVSAWSNTFDYPTQMTAGSIERWLSEREQYRHDTTIPLGDDPKYTRRCLKQTVSDAGLIDAVLKRKLRSAAPDERPELEACRRAIRSFLRSARKELKTPVSVVAATPAAESTARGVGQNPVDGPRELRQAARKPEFDQETAAIAYMAHNKHATMLDIAKAVGANRATLYRWPKLRDVAEKLGRLKPRGMKSRHLRRGFKTADGRIEAVADAEDNE